MNRIRFSALTLGLAALLSGRTSGAMAQKVGIVNVQAVLAAMPAYVLADSQLKAEFLTYQREVNALQDLLQTDAAKFQQNSLALSPTQKDLAQKKLQARSDSIQGVWDRHQKDLQARRDQVLGPLEDQVTKVIEGLRLTGGYSMILNYAIDPNPIVAVDKDLDITQKAIEAVKALSKPPAAAVDPAKKGGGGNP